MYFLKNPLSQPILNPPILCTTSRQAGQQHADASWGCFAHPIIGAGCIGSGNGPFDPNHDDPGDSGGSSDDN